MNSLYVDAFLARADNWWFGSDFWLTWPMPLAAGPHVLKVLTGGSHQCTLVPPPPGASDPPLLLPLYPQNGAVRKQTVKGVGWAGRAMLHNAMYSFSLARCSCSLCFPMLSS